MHTHHPKRPDGCIELNPHRAARLESGQVVMAGLTDRDRIATPYHCISVPSQTARPTQIDDLPSGLIQHELRQRGRPWRQTFVSLLQHNDIGTHPLKNLKDALGLTPEIKADTFLDIVAGKPQNRWYFHIAFQSQRHRFGTFGMGALLQFSARSLKGL
jgi:hypothetical protein